MWNPSNCDYECNKACKIDEYLDIESCPCKKRLFGKLLVFACLDEILNTTETSLVGRKVTCEKINCLIYTLSLVIYYLLYELLYLCKINNINEISVKNHTYYLFDDFIKNRDRNKIEIEKYKFIQKYSYLPH